MGLAALASALLTLTLLISPTQAQQRTKPPAKEAPKEQAQGGRPADAPAPYDRDLMRMAEVIGSLAFLRGPLRHPRCLGMAARMKALIEAEGITPARGTARGAYNGVSGYALTYDLHPHRARGGGRSSPRASACPTPWPGGSAGKVMRFGHR